MSKSLCYFLIPVCFAIMSCTGGIVGNALGGNTLGNRPSYDTVGNLYVKLAKREYDAPKAIPVELSKKKSDYIKGYRQGWHKVMRGSYTLIRKSGSVKTKLSTTIPELVSNAYLRGFLEGQSVAIITLRQKTKSILEDLSKSTGELDTDSGHDRATDE